MFFSPPRRPPLKLKRSSRESDSAIQAITDQFAAEFYESFYIVVKCAMETDMPAYCARQAFVQNSHHEMLVRSIGLNIVGGEAERRGRLKTKSRIVAGVPHEKHQAVVHFAHRLHSRSYQCRANALSLMRRRHRNRTQSGKSVYDLTISDRRQAVSRMTDDLVVQDRNLRQHKRVVRAKKIDEISFGAASKCGFRCLVDYEDI